MKQNRFWLALGAVLLGATVFLTACGGDSTAAPAPAPTTFDVTVSGE